MSRASFLLPLLLAAACGDAVITRHDAVISPTLAPCTGVAAQMCMQVAEDGGEPSLFYDAIEGFTFTWGTEATVRYAVEELDDPPADGSSRIYRLEELVAEEVDPPGTQYEITFPPRASDDDWFQSTTGSGPVRVVDMLGTDVTCAESVCLQLLSGSQVESTRVTLELPTPPGAMLRVVSLVR